STYFTTDFTNVLSYPDDDLPIQSKGGCQLYFDNLDAINLFQGSTKMVLSPARPSELVETPKAEEERERNVIKAVSDRNEKALDDTLPFMPSVENVLADFSADMCSTDGSVITMMKDPADELSNAGEEETVPSVNLDPDQAVAIISTAEETPLPPKGTYEFDFDNLDSVNPFQTGGSKLQHSPVLGRKRPCDDPQKVEVEEPAVKEMETAAMLEVVQPVLEAPVQPEMKRIAPLSTAPKETSKPAEESITQPSAAPSKDGAVKLEFNFDDGGEVKCKPPPKKFGKRPVLKPTWKKADNIPQNPKLQMDSCEVQYPSSGKEQEPPTKPDRPSLSTPQPLELCQFEQTPQNGMSELNELFVPGNTFMVSDFDRQMDYLEQFGSSTFKESALRKQSLYLNFDPLMRESPKKSGVPAGLNNLPRPAPFASRVETQKTGAEEVTGLKSVNPKLRHDLPPVQVVGPRTLVANSPVLENLVPTFPQPANPDDNIEVLKYSQQDMNAAIAKIRKQAKKNADEWKSKHDTLSQDNREMGKIMSALEATTAQILADKQRKMEKAQADITKVLQEKEPLSQDLNAMERSFSDLVKRLDEYKEVIEGYIKNEEMLKKCAQDYLSRIEEKQRYQTLEAHAEHKLSLANGEIAEVRSKLKPLVAALQAQLRREQIKAQSLGKSLDQKVSHPQSEVVHEGAFISIICSEKCFALIMVDFVFLLADFLLIFYNLCDELIAKVQKG
ncbi:transforming acidic coiled-coil-containing protein 3-like, partial [Salvelinus alpinus]|uniref:transforming acidic coiled-coil-containing protein 3-like n=1 Tax=Salvelinus alpinus TaxID=8036 RepID=UPI0039FC3CA8